MTARACANIALVKYWGKRHEALNLPAAGSLSLTLSGMETVTRVAFREDLPEDAVNLDGHVADGKSRQRVVTFLDRIRTMAGIANRAEVVSRNTFPTAAGLASSASGFAALALASSRAAGLSLSPEELSVLARLGSGSACRSVFGGFAEWLPGSDPSGADSYAVQVLSAEQWDVRMLVAVLAAGPKAVGSREGMRRTQATSPYYPAWVASVPGDLAAARAAIAERNIARLGELAEANALRMHASMLAAQPPLLYWLPQTIAAVRRVWELRAEGLSCWSTIDAGPNVKVLCDPADAAEVRSALAALPDVREILECHPGPGAALQAWPA